MLSHLLAPEIARTLRESERFRVLARRLHPDLNPSQSPAAAELWHRVTSAYEAQDLAELDALEILIRDVDSVPPPDSLADLYGMFKKLRTQLDQLLTTLASRRKIWHFDQLPLLDDPAATAVQQAELDSRIATAESLRDV